MKRPCLVLLLIPGWLACNHDANDFRVLARDTCQSTLESLKTLRSRVTSADVKAQVEERISVCENELLGGKVSRAVARHCTEAMPELTNLMRETTGDQQHRVAVKMRECKLSAATREIAAQEGADATAIVGAIRGRGESDADRAELARRVALTLTANRTALAVSVYEGASAAGWLARDDREVVALAAKCHDPDCVPVARAAFAKLQLKMDPEKKDAHVLVTLLRNQKKAGATADDEGDVVTGKQYLEFLVKNQLIADLEAAIEAVQCAELPTSPDTTAFMTEAQQQAYYLRKALKMPAAPQGKKPACKPAKR